MELIHQLPAMTFPLQISWTARIELHCHNLAVEQLQEVVQIAGAMDAMLAFAFLAYHHSTSIKPKPPHDLTAHCEISNRKGHKVIAAHFLPRRDTAELGALCSEYLHE